MWEKLQNIRNIRVKGVFFPVAVSGESVGCIWFERRRDVGVYPEGPKGVVEVEDDEFWQGESWISEG